LLLVQRCYYLYEVLTAARMSALTAADFSAQLLAQKIDQAFLLMNMAPPYLPLAGE
jgi:hypothetical protein